MGANPGSNEQRLRTLEEKLEYQEYTIDKLNEVVIAQQQQLNGLEDDLRRLTTKIESGPGRHLAEKKVAAPLPPSYYESWPKG